MPFFAGLGVAIILFFGAFFDRIDLALIAIIGANIFLYVPDTPIYHKMILCMSCSFGIITSFTLGLIGNFFPSLIPLIIFLVTMISAQVVRYFNIGVPGFFFFTFATVLGTYIHLEPKDYFMAIGLVSLGTMVANIMVMLYALSVIYIFKHKPKPMQQIGESGFGVIVIDPVIIAFFVSLATILQGFLELDRGYWASLSCAAVLTAVTFKQVWIKQLHRILGTIVGVILAYILLHFNFTLFEFAFLMMILMFFAELFVVRNYALAMVFLTPYSTYLVEVGNFMHYDPISIIYARVLDIIVGSVIGLVGGAVLYWNALRKHIEKVAVKVFFRWNGK
ncbi:MAG: FUSC family protein [Helicobacter sp.]|nr:FUSC family protein [Helicobacter sp.]